MSFDPFFTYNLEIFANMPQAGDGTFNQYTTTNVLPGDLFFATSGMQWNVAVKMTGANAGEIYLLPKGSANYQTSVDVFKTITSLYYGGAWSNDGGTTNGGAVPVLIGAATDTGQKTTVASLALVLGPVTRCVAPGGLRRRARQAAEEAGRGEVPGGVVRDPAVHLTILERVLRTAAGLGLDPIDVMRSPLLGPAGNREFFAHLGVPDPAAPAAPAGSARLDLAARVAACTAP